MTQFESWVWRVTYRTINLLSSLPCEILIHVRLPIRIPDRIPICTLSSLKSDARLYSLLCLLHKAMGSSTKQISNSAFSLTQQTHWSNGGITHSLGEVNAPWKDIPMYLKTTTCQVNPLPLKNLWRPSKFTLVALCSLLISAVVQKELTDRWIRQGCQDLPNSSEFTN